MGQVMALVILVDVDYWLEGKIKDGALSQCGQEGALTMDHVATLET